MLIMIYFKVKPEHDNKYKNPKIHDGNIYIANELYTEKEVIRQNLNRSFLEQINVNKNETYFCFGARFCS